MAPPPLRLRRPLLLCLCGLCGLGLSLPLPKALSPVALNDARLQSAHSDFYVKLQRDGAALTARTTLADSAHFDLTVVSFVDVAFEGLWAVRSRAGDAYLSVDGGGARTTTLDMDAMDKDSAAHCLFRRKDTSCPHTVAFESVSEPGRFLSESCAADATDSCTLRLSPLPPPASAPDAAPDAASAPDASACLLPGQPHPAPRSLLFRLL